MGPDLDGSRVNRPLVGALGHGALVPALIIHHLPQCVDDPGRVLLGVHHSINVFVCGRMLVQKRGGLLIPRLAL